MNFVGYMRNYKSPSSLARLIAIFCKSYGIELIYLRPNDITATSKFVNGEIFLNNKWHKVEVPLPRFIDISQYCFKKFDKKTYKFLLDNTILSDNNQIRLNKMELQLRLQKDKQFKDLIIPSKIAQNYEDVIEFLVNYKKIILKPLSGQFGSNVFQISNIGSKFIVVYENEEKEISEEDLVKFINDLISKRRYLLQKYIHSKTKQGYPFDCRINVEKNFKGEWETARIFIRIGIGQKVVSNLSQGGGVSQLKPFLKSNFKEYREDINKKINEIANTLPYKIELLRKCTLMTIGIDLGIDLNGKVYLFETNGAPGTKQLRAEVALLRSSYYKYVLDN